MEIQHIKASLATQIARGKELLGGAVFSSTTYEEVDSGYSRWVATNQAMVKKFFGQEVYAKEYLGPAGVMIDPDEDLFAKVGRLHRSIKSEITRLETLFDTAEYLCQPASVNSISSKRIPARRAVFIVMGMMRLRKR